MVRSGTMSGVGGEFTDAADAISERTQIATTRVEEDGWHVWVAFGFPQQDEGLVLRAIAVMVVPADPDDIPAGGLTQRRLQQLVVGITSDAAADARVMQQQQTYELQGLPPMTPEEERELRNETQRLARRRGKGEGRGFGPDFYATVALDAIDAAGKGRQGDVTKALESRYMKSDPRSRDKRTRVIEYTTVRGWISTARNRFGFLPATGGKGRRVYAPTEALKAHLADVGKLLAVDVTMAPRLETRLIKKGGGK